MDDLFDVAGYIESLDVSNIEPPHLDLIDKEITQKYCIALGWYEKTEHGVESLVKIY